MAKEKKPTLADDPNDFSVASNDSDAIETFENRTRYRDEVFPAVAPFSHFNFWQEDRFYGRINSLGNPVILREDRLKQLKYCNSPAPLFTFNFVADAWRDFIEKVRDETTQGRLSTSGPYAKMEAKKAWQSIPTQYHDYMVNEVYPVFSEIFMSVLGSNDEKVRDFNSFLRVFTDFSETAIKRGSSMTMTGYVESIMCSPINTGLIIEISDAAHDADYTKCDEFLYDQNFTAIIRIASNYGFVIDKNAPWRFVADIRSPAMREYMTGVRMTGPSIPMSNNLLPCDVPFIRDFNVPETYGFSNVDGIQDCIRHAPGYEEYEELKYMTTEEDIFKEFFTQAYLETWSVDMDVLKLYLLDFYNTYVSSVPVVSRRRLSDAFGNFKCINPLRPEFKTEVIFRQVVSSAESLFGPKAGLYRDKWSLKSYYNLRLMERRSQKTSSMILKDVQNFMNIYYFAPLEPVGTKYAIALRHIQENLIGPVTTDFLTFGKVGDKMTTQESRNFDFPNPR
jgi:hypothetical protein